MLTFPELGDRMVVLAAGLVMILGLAYIVNWMRERTESKRRKSDNDVSQG